MSIFEKIISSNKKFFTFNRGNNKSGTLLFELFLHEKPLIYGLAKVALYTSNIKNLSPLGIIPVKLSNSNSKFLKSFGMRTTGDLLSLAIVFFKHLPQVCLLFFKASTKEGILDLKFKEYEIGNHIYDSILRSLLLPTLSKITVKVRVKVLLEIIYFFFFLETIAKNKVKFIVISDCVYRYGILFEIAKKDGIPCLSPVSLNNFSVALNTVPEHFESHYRKPEEQILNSINPKDAKAALNDYFAKRYTASIEQHDVLKAYDANKRILSRAQLDEEYNLDPDKPLIMVMSHIFCDAPHCYPGSLYDDYYEWCIRSISLLALNKNVNVLIKEHPSADLYGEKGIISMELNKLNLHHLLLADDVHNISILQGADVVVTCGGTIGQEFAYFKKPVVLAAKPPYSEFGFTIDFSNRENYEGFLLNGIENAPTLTSLQMEKVYQVLYYDFILTDNYSDELELGGQRYYMGREFDEDEFFNNIISSNEIPYKDQILYKMLKKFYSLNNKHILK